MAFIDDMVTKYETLLESAAGLSTVTIDGQVVSYQDLEAKYEYWKRKQAIAGGTRPRASRINLQGF